MFTAHVRRTIGAAHHNGPPGHKCLTNHGHSWVIDVEISYPEERLSEYGWGPDFGVIKSILDSYDHQDLNEMMAKPSAEFFSKTLFHLIAERTSFTPDWVKVAEGPEGNEVTYFDDNALNAED